MSLILFKIPLLQQVLGESDVITIQSGILSLSLSIAVSCNPVGSFFFVGCCRNSLLFFIFSIMFYKQFPDSLEHYSVFVFGFFFVAACNCMYFKSVASYSLLMKNLSDQTSKVLGSCERSIRILFLRVGRICAQL